MILYNQSLSEMVTGIYNKTCTGSNPTFVFDTVLAPRFDEYIYNELYIQQVPFGNCFPYDCKVI